MSRTVRVITCASLVLAVGLSSPILSGTASAEGELGQGGEWPDAAYSNSPDNDWQSEADLSAITAVLNQVWADQLSDPAVLRLSIAERDALMAEAEEAKRIAMASGAAELEAQAAQAQAASDMVSGAMSVGSGTSGSGISASKGASTGSSAKGGATDSSTLKSPGRSPTSP